MGSGVIAPPFLTSTLDGGDWLASGPGRLILKESPLPGTNWIGGWAGPFGRYGEEKNILPLQGIKPRFLDGLVLGPVAILTELSTFKNPVPTYQKTPRVQSIHFAQETHNIKR
jgi:hypothetical protein